MNETDEEMDTAAIEEEEEWEEYKYPMLDQYSQKNEMEAGAENRIATGREMDSESC